MVALVLKLIEMRAVQFGHDMFFPEAIAKLAKDQHRFILGSSVYSFRDLCFIRGWFSLARTERDLTVS